MRATSAPAGERPLMPLTIDQAQRYSRQMLLEGVGAHGQERLLASSVLCIGAGGLGSPVLSYLAGAGIGRIGIMDGDRLELSNLHRQVIHSTRDLGRPKAESACSRLRMLNPDAEVEIYSEALNRENALRIIPRYDALVDASDNFPTRFLANDACFLAGKPLFFGSAVAWEGQAASFFTSGPAGPCYRCLFGDVPPLGAAPSANEIGILGPVAGVIGAIQAAECIRHLAGLGAALAGRLLVHNGAQMSFRHIPLRRNPDCPLCGDRPTISRSALPDYTGALGTNLET